MKQSENTGSFKAKDNRTQEEELFSFCGCSEQDSEIIKSNTNEGSLTEYKLIYFDPIQGQYHDKAILLSDEGVEAQIIYELFKKENISEVLYDQLKMDELELLEVTFISDEKLIEIKFNHVLYDIKDDYNSASSLRTIVYKTLAQFDTVDVVNFYANDTLIKGANQFDLSGEIYHDDKN